MNYTKHNKTADPLYKELNELDSELVEIDGSQLKPSQCYHVETDPFHILFNTNCPETLKQKVQAILAKHMHPDESSSQK